LLPGLVPGGLGFGLRLFSDTISTALNSPSEKRVPVGDVSVLGIVSALVGLIHPELNRTLPQIKGKKSFTLTNFFPAPKLLELNSKLVFFTIETLAPFPRHHFTST
jgi:hypothetical protein